MTVVGRIKLKVASGMFHSPAFLFFFGLFGLSMGTGWGCGRSNLTTASTSGGGTTNGATNGGGSNGGFGSTNSGGGSGGGSTSGPITAPGSSCTTSTPLFVDAIAEADWHNIDLVPGDGMAGLRQALLALTTAGLAELPADDPRRTRPVRIRLAAGTYAATDPGVGDLFFGGIHRTAANPLLIMANNAAANATVLTQGLNLVAIDFVAIDGVTVGPATVGPFNSGSQTHSGQQPLNAQAGIHVSGYVPNASASGQQGGTLDFSVFGQQHPSDNVLIRRVTIQNVFSPDAESAVLSEGSGADGIKFNQASNVWVLSSTINQASRHGIDNVAVHNAKFCNNVIANNGVGVGIEAKGGSVNVLIDSNVFVNTRRVFLGGEKTDATYYWSTEPVRSAEHYTYEARNVVARNNIVVNGRETAFAFSGCHDCALVNNTVYFDYAAGSGGRTGHALREADTTINEDGASAECVSNEGGDAVEVCWGVGAYPAEFTLQADNPGTEENERRMRPLTNQRNSMYNNLFINQQGFWDNMSPYDHNGIDSRSLPAGQSDYNYWFNGGQAIADGGGLAEGTHSLYTGAASQAPGLAATSLSLATVPADPTQAADLVAFRTQVLTSLKPSATSVLRGSGKSDVGTASNVDAAGVARSSATIGALMP